MTFREAHMARKISGMGGATCSLILGEGRFWRDIVKYCMDSEGMVIRS